MSDLTDGMKKIVSGELSPVTVGGGGIGRHTELWP